MNPCNAPRSWYYRSAVNVHGRPVLAREVRRGALSGAPLSALTRLPLFSRTDLTSAALWNLLAAYSAAFLLRKAMILKVWVQLRRKP